MIGPLGRKGPAATLRQHCPQMTQRPGMNVRYGGVEAAFTITSVNDHDAAKTHASKVRLLKHNMQMHLYCPFVMSRTSMYLNPPRYFWPVSTEFIISTESKFF